LPSLHAYLSDSTAAKVEALLQARPGESISSLLAEAVEIRHEQLHGPCSHAALRCEVCGRQVPGP
jgi:hypothetical protein